MADGGAGDGRARRAALPRRGSAPTLVGDLLASARVRTRAAAGIAIDRETWRRLVGARIAHAAVPGRIRNRELTVSAASAVWVQELSLLSDEILARLRTHGLEVDTIRFRVTASARAPAGRPVERPLPIVLPEELQERLESVADPELRATIARAAAYSLAAATPAANSGPTSGRPTARDPRSAAPKSVRPDPGAAGPRAKPRRTRGGRGD